MRALISTVSVNEGDASCFTLGGCALLSMSLRKVRVTCHQEEAFRIPAPRLPEDGDQ